jgi:3'-5' exoribonuclease
MRRLYLRDCAPGDLVEDVFVITNKQLSATSTGKFFIKAFCSDRTSQITARLWNATRDIFNTIPESGFLRIRGRIENYQNNLQLIIEKTWAAKDGTFDVSDLIPHTSRDIDQMCQRLFEICGSIQNRHLCALIAAYLDDEELMNNFCRAPAAMNFHHAFIGGLLEHTLNAMEVADAICRFYPTLNRDLVVAGIFLHDIAKTWELSYDCSFGYTDGGQLVGHIVKSAMWVETKAKEAAESLGEPIPQALIDVIQHIILSHHGLPEFGAARVPSTPEAIAVHVIENLDAKMMMALSLTRGDSASGGSPSGGSEGNWTEYLKAFNGRLYRPDVAPADAQAMDEQAPEDRAGAPSEKSNGEHGPDQPRSAVAMPVHPPADVPVPSAPAGASGKIAITNPLFESVPRKR